MSTELKNKVALVTDGSRNSGRETALALAERGADVVITYCERWQAVEQTVLDLQAMGVQAAAIQVDFSESVQLDRFIVDFKYVLANWGRSDFDILMNNAGMLRLVPFDMVTEADLDAIYQVNYKSVFLLTQRLLNDIADGGRIINIGLGAAHFAFGSLVSYGPLKAALQALTLYLASLLGQRRITVNAVAPDGLNHEFHGGLLEGMPQACKRIALTTAGGRIGRSSDVGSLIAFLCTEEASCISGAIIPVDG